MIRIGYGEDTHALVPDRPLRLAGLDIPSSRGPRAHSDGDALLHALADALLSALALGDIGELFPDTDPRWRDLESRTIVLRVLGELHQRGWRLAQLSAVVILDQPKLAPHRQAMVESLARLLALSEDRIGLTFKTSEGLAPDFVQTRVMVLIEPSS